MPKHLLKTVTVLLLSVAVLTGCGGGEEADDLLDSASEVADQYEFPHRGPEWLMAPSEAVASEQG